MRRMQLDAIESGSLSTGRRIGECLGELMQIGNRGLHRHDAGLRVGDGRRPRMRLLGGWSFVAEPPYTICDTIAVPCA